MKKFLLIVAVVIFSFGNIYGQQLWKKVSNIEALSEKKLPRDSNPKEFEVYALNMELLKSKLAAAPSRKLMTPSTVVISFPDSQGKLQRYYMYEASVLDPELAAKHPEIQSYIGKGIDDPSATISLSTTLFGLHTMTLSAHGTFYIDPYTSDLQNYIVYSRENLTSSKARICGVQEKEVASTDDTPTGSARANNGLFKTYRLAMACTTEYATFHINRAGLQAGTVAAQKTPGLAAMKVSIVRINGVYERDMSLTMVIIPNNEDIIFIAEDDGFANNSPGTLIDESQAKIDALIGTANYDIGHTVSTQGGGLAIAAVCQSLKASGITGINSPVGDPYDIDFVAHEMGHQFGASHTFNSDQDNCGDNNRVGSSSFEPGSGTTIMAYAGICAPDNVQLHSDAYFHARSIIQMQNAVNGSANCATAVANGNAAPVVNPGSNYTIPFGTAFVLTGSATDADDEALTYCWEQYNQQISEQPPLPTSTTGPNFRSISPTLTPERYFPSLTNVLANNLRPTWEVVPNVARTMLFSLMVRDNGGPNGGQTNRDVMTLTFANTGPFKVTSQNSIVAWAKDTQETVTWDVAGTDANGINTQFVRIKLSIDGGLTFPYTLAESTENDGSQAITVPNTPASQNCRIKIEAIGNVYYAVNTTAFMIGYRFENSCTTYTYTGEPFAVPNGATTYTIKTITVPTSAIVSDVNVSVNATHPNIQNLTIAIQRPAVGTALLFNQQCAGTANLDVTFDSQAPAFACSSPMVGTFAPATGYNLSLLNDSNQQGNWVFGFRDTVAGADQGTINSFAVEICSQTVILLATEAFGFNDFALYPNPNKGNFTVQFESKSNQKINIAVHDLRGRKIFDQSYNNSGMFSQNLQLDKAQAGIYLISITDGDKKVTKRIVVE